MIQNLSRRPPGDQNISACSNEPPVEVNQPPVEAEHYSPYSRFDGGVDGGGGWFGPLRENS